MAASVPPLTVTASARFPVAQVPRVSSSARADIAALIDAASPVLVTPDVADIGVGRLQAPGDLRRIFHDKPVSVNVDRHESFRDNQDGSKRIVRRMPFGDFASYVENSDRYGDERLYLSQFPLDAASLALSPHLAVPAYVPEDSRVVSANLWFGPAGTISPLHFDQNHNLLHQHYGRKHVILVNPSHFDLLKPGEKNSPGEHVSSLDLVTSAFNINLSSLKLSCSETDLGPGDILFIPAFWWHHVMSMDISISINYWWRAPINACLYPGLFRFFSSRFVYDDISVIARAFDLGQHKLDTGLCLFLAEQGHIFGAAALAGAMVMAFCDRTLRVLGHTGCLASGASASEQPDFAQARTVVHALAAQNLTSDSQAELLLKWLELAEEAVSAPEPPVYSPLRRRGIYSMVLRLHLEFAEWLSM
ncbi:MAG: cupin-like domain-containing protein [Streptosporangiaceae bacterium]|jgi:hypothetical protein